MAEREEQGELHPRYLEEDQELLRQQTVQGSTCIISLSLLFLTRMLLLLENQPGHHRRFSFQEERPLRKRQREQGRASRSFATSIT